MPVPPNNRRRPPRRPEIEPKLSDATKPSAPYIHTHSNCIDDNSSSRIVYSPLPLFAPLPRYTHIELVSHAFENEGSESLPSFPAFPNWMAREETMEFFQSALNSLTTTGGMSLEELFSENFKNVDVGREPFALLIPLLLLLFPLLRRCF